MALPLLLLGGAALFTGFKMVGKLFGNDPDFTQAWMMNRMSGQGGFFKTFFADGLKGMFLGSRTASAAYGAYGMGPGLYGAMGGMGGMGMGGMGGYGAMGGMNPYMANPYMMGGMPYGPMSMGPMMWGRGF